MRLLLFLAFLPIIINAQTVQINVTVLQAFSPQAKLFIYNGSATEIVDSVFQFDNGEYRFTLGEGYKQGLYKVMVGKGIAFNFVVADEPIIDISTVAYAPEDSLKSANSVENTVYWRYQQEKKRHGGQTWLLRSLMDFYPDSVMFHHLLMKELEVQNQHLYSLAKSIYKQNPNLLSAKLIFTEQRPEPPSLLHNDYRANLLREIWWQDIDFSDTRLLNSPALTNRLWGYIEMLFSDNFHKEEQDSAFINGIDNLMKIEMLDDMKSIFRSTLIEGFINTDYQEVIRHLKTAHFGSLKPLKENGSPEKRSKDIPRVKVGEKAYDFFVCLPDGKRVKLSKLKADYKLLLFWSSWCPHCIESMPRFVDVYNTYRDKGLEIIAISLDDENVLWESYIKKLNLNWINMREPYSPESKILNMYEVEETPKMFLLSNDLTILSRPSTQRQLEVRLRRLIK